MKKKVLHIISGIGQGGAERQLLELLKKNSSHALCVLGSGGYFEYEINKLGIPVWYMNMGKIFINPYKLVYLKKIILNFNPDVIHCWMYHACFLTVILKNIFKIKIPFLWGVRCSDMDTSKYSYKLKLVVFACKLFSNIPNCIVYNSENGLLFHKSVGFTNKNSSVIPNGISIKKFKRNISLRKKIRNNFGIEKGTVVLLKVARMDPMKGHYRLLQVFKKINKNMKNIKLILAGLGTDKIELPENVIALGAYDKIEEVYSVADIIICASEYGEGFSNALAEGMASGLVPIATNVGDSEKIIKNIGIVVDRNNNEHLEKAILQFLDINSQKFMEKQQKSREHIKNNYSLDTMVKSYDALYNDITK